MSLSVHVALIQQAGTLPYKGGERENERKRKITRKGVGNSFTAECHGQGTVGDRYYGLG